MRQTLDLTFQMIFYRKVQSFTTVICYRNCTEKNLDGFLLWKFQFSVSYSPSPHETSSKSLSIHPVLASPTSPPCMLAIMPTQVTHLVHITNQPVIYALYLYPPAHVVSSSYRHLFDSLPTSPVIYALYFYPPAHVVSSPHGHLFASPPT
jgi:hypothetical protein